MDIHLTKDHVSLQMNAKELQLMEAGQVGPSGQLALMAAQTVINHALGIHSVIQKFQKYFDKIDIALKILFLY